MKKDVITHKKFKFNSTTLITAFLSILLIVGCFGYIGSIYTYRITVIYMLFVFLSLMFVICISKRINKIPNEWRIVLIYMIISVPLLNISNSIRYFIVFLACMALLKIRLTTNFYLKLPSLFAIIGFIFSLMTLFQIYLPSIFFNILRIIQNNNLYLRTIEYEKIYGVCCGIAGEPSFNAFCITIGIMGIVSGIFSSKKLQKSKIILLIIMYFSILLTGKRSFMLFIPVIVFSIFLIKEISQNRRKSIIICFLIMIILPIVFYSFLGDIVMNILSKGADSSTTVVNLSNREIFWQIALNMIKDRPFFGHGLMSYDNFYNAFFNNAHTFAGAHNSYLQLLSELGIVGGCIYIYAIIHTLWLSYKSFWYCCKKNIKYLDRNILFALCLQTVCVMYGFSGNPFHRPQQLLTYFVGVCIALFVEKKLKGDSNANINYK